jgi:hypothetical protein
MTDLTDVRRLTVLLEVKDANIEALIAEGRALARAGSHEEGCPATWRETCDCGWADRLFSWSALIETMGAAEDAAAVEELLADDDSDQGGQP